jgi:selenocysteine lyase/cysteine desulfurase
LSLGSAENEVNHWRKLFPVVGHVVHLNHAGVSPISTRVADAVRGFVDQALQIDNLRYQAWEQKSEQVRELCARLIGAQSDQIAFVKNTSEGLSFVAAGLDWREGDNIVAVDGEYPSNVYPWWAQRRHGVEVRMIPRRQGVVERQDVENACDSRTRVVTVSFVDWLTGARNDLASLGKVAHRYGALFCVDGIQGVGVLPLDVRALEIDCLAVGGHKWLLAPEGCGWLYLCERALGQIQSVVHGWKSVSNPDEYLPYHFEPRPDASRFESGTLPHLGICALGAAVELLSEVGVENVWHRVASLTDLLAHRLRCLGAEVLSPWEPERRSGIVVFRLSGDNGKLADELNRNGFIVRARGGGVRVAPHFYNTEEEIQRFVDRLAALL